MHYSNFLLIIIFLVGYIVMFNKKLIILLMLESFMITIIFTHSYSSGVNSISYFFLSLMTLFMVLDSVFGISILIFSSRNSSCMNSSVLYL